MFNGLKDFLILNIKHCDYILPCELVQYIYSYIINDEFKINMNNQYICYSIRKKLDNNKRWLLESLRFNKLLDEKLENICLPVGWGYWKRYKQIPRLCNTHENITLNEKDLPYKYVNTSTDAFHTIWEYLDKFDYSYIKYEVDGKYYASSYINKEDLINSVDHLLVKIFSNK